VSFAVRRATTGFVALGWPATPALMMVGSDAVIGWGGANPSILPYHLGGQTVSQILPNPKLNISAASVSLINGVTTLKFTRPLHSGSNPIANATTMNIIASTHETSQNLAYHTCRVQRLFTVNLLSGKDSDVESGRDIMRTIHGSLMMTGWGVFLVLGMLVARYGRNAFPDGLWLIFHQLFQTTGLLFITAGFILAEIMVHGAHFATTYHSQLGTAIIGGAYLQYLSGIIRPHHDPGQPKTTIRKLFEVLHPNWGRLLCISATVNIFTGIRIIGWPFFVLIIYAVWVAFLIILSIFLEVRKRLTEAAYKKMDYV